MAGSESGLTVESIKRQRKCVLLILTNFHVRARAVSEVPANKCTTEPGTLWRVGGSVQAIAADGSQELMSMLPSMRLLVGFAADDGIRRMSQRGCDLSKAYPLPPMHTHTATATAIFRATVSFDAG